MATHLDERFGAWLDGASKKQGWEIRKPKLEYRLAASVTLKSQNNSKHVNTLLGESCWKLETNELPPQW